MIVYADPMLVGNRWEYIIMTCTREELRSSFEPPHPHMDQFRNEGWVIAWADHTMEGSFFVLRREVKKG